MKQKIYIGPTVPGLIRNNAIYKDKLPVAVEARAKKDKSFARLIVPVEKVIAARKELATKCSVLAVSYDNVRKSMREEDKIE